MSAKTKSGGNKRRKGRKGSASGGGGGSRGGGIMRSMRSGFKTTVGVKETGRPPSKLGTVVTVLLVAAAIALLFYRFY